MRRCRGANALMQPLPSASRGCCNIVLIIASRERHSLSDRRLSASLGVLELLMNHTTVTIRSVTRTTDSLQVRLLEQAAGK